MSTTTRLSIAVRYSASRSCVLLRVNTKSLIERGESRADPIVDVRSVPWSATPEQFVSLNRRTAADVPEADGPCRGGGRRPGNLHGRGCGTSSLIALEILVGLSVRW
eukprot:5429852-Prymnesium_polylepis.2